MNSPESSAPAEAKVQEEDLSCERHDKLNCSECYGGFNPAPRVEAKVSATDWTEESVMRLYVNSGGQPSGFDKGFKAVADAHNRATAQLRAENEALRAKVSATEQVSKEAVVGAWKSFEEWAESEGFIQDEEHAFFKTGLEIWREARKGTSYAEVAKLCEARTVAQETSADLRHQLTQAQEQLQDEQERHAQLQSRCYEGFPTVSDGIFDAYKEAQEQQLQLSAALERKDAKVQRALEGIGTDARFFTVRVLQEVIAIKPNPALLREHDQKVREP